MGQENRTLTALPWYETQDPTATPPELGHDRASDWNYWQDYGMRVMSLDGTMSPPNVGFEKVEGCLKVYGQSASIASGGASEAFEIRNWNNTGIPDAYDLTQRLIECTVWTESSAAELPKGESYDPDTFQNSPISHVWYTGAGATDGAPPAGDYWTPWAGIYIYAGDTDVTSFRCYNNSGAAIFLVFMGTFTQRIV